MGGPGTGAVERRGRRDDVAVALGRDPAVAGGRRIESGNAGRDRLRDHRQRAVAAGRLDVRRRIDHDDCGSDRTVEGVDRRGRAGLLLLEAFDRPVAGARHAVAVERGAMLVAPVVGDRQELTADLLAATLDVLVDLPHVLRRRDHVLRGRRRVLVFVLEDLALDLARLERLRHRLGRLQLVLLGDLGRLLLPLDVLVALLVPVLHAQRVLGRRSAPSGSRSWWSASSPRRPGASPAGTGSSASGYGSSRVSSARSASGSGTSNGTCR